MGCQSSSLVGSALVIRAFAMAHQASRSLARWPMATAYVRILQSERHVEAVEGKSRL